MLEQAAEHVLKHAAAVMIEERELRSGEPAVEEKT